MQTSRESINQLPRICTNALKHDGKDYILGHIFTSHNYCSQVIYRQQILTPSPTPRIIIKMGIYYRILISLQNI